jgi:hypothetical protein
MAILVAITVFFAPYFLILEAKRIFLARYPSFCTIFRKKRAF